MPFRICEALTEFRLAIKEDFWALLSENCRNEMYFILRNKNSKFNSSINNDIL